MEIALVPGAVEEAHAFLVQYQAEHARLEQVERLIDGFETPYGMELLSSVHWLAVKAEPRATDVDGVVRGMAAWNPRKANLFKPAHIRVAWDRLVEENRLQTRV